MQMESFKNQTESLTKILLAITVLLGALLFLRIGSFVNSSQAMTTMDPLDASLADPDNVKTVLAQTRASANDLKRNNLFVPGAARQYPVTDVMGILGHEALIGGKWYQEGDSVGEARIVAIEPTKVRVVWEGQEKVFAPIGATNPPVAGGRFDRSSFSGKRAGPSGSDFSGNRSGPSGPAKTVITGSRPEPSRKSKSSTLSAQEREERRNRWTNASPAEKQRFQETYQKSKGKGKKNH